MRASAEEEEKRQFMFDSLVVGTSLQEMLLEQVRESALPEDQWPIAEMLIGNIDDYGYLKATVGRTGSLHRAAAGPDRRGAQGDTNLRPAGRRRAGLARVPAVPVGAPGPAEHAGIPHRQRIHGCARQAADPRNRPRHGHFGGRGAGGAGAHRPAGAAARPRLFAGQRPVHPAGGVRAQSRATILWSRPTTNTSRTCASATPTRT